MAETEEERKAREEAFVREDYCPVCAYKFDSASPADDDGARPGPGSFTLCLNCGEILRYNENMITIIPSPGWEDQVRNEAEEEGESEECEKFLESVFLYQEVIRRRGRIH